MKVYIVSHIVRTSRENCDCRFICYETHNYEVCTKIYVKKNQAIKHILECYKPIGNSIYMAISKLVEHDESDAACSLLSHLDKKIEIIERDLEGHILS